MKQAAGKPDAQKVFRAIALIISARDGSAQVRLANVKQIQQDVRKAG